MHKQILNLPDIEASEAEYYAKGSGFYTGIAGATNAFQAYSNEKLRSLKADAVIEAGYTDRATVEFLFNAMFYPVFPTAAHTPTPDGSYFSVTVSSMVSLSEGSVTIRSASMADAPIINPNVCIPFFQSLHLPIATSPMYPPWPFIYSLTFHLVLFSPY